MRDATGGAEVVASPLFWTLRMPLSTDAAGWGYINLYREFGGDGLLLDVNYLSNLFQKELALAAERVFTRAGAGAVAGRAPSRASRARVGSAGFCVVDSHVGKPC